MKFFFSFFLFVSTWFQIPNLSEIRKKFPEAHKDKTAALAFYTLLNENIGKSNTAQAYKAAATIVKAKFEKPAQRKKLMQQGAFALEEAVKNEPNNAEIRLIRMSIQENLPTFIGYHGSIAADKAFLTKHYSAQSSSVKLLIRDFVAQSRSFNAEEKKGFK